MFWLCIPLVYYLLCRPSSSSCSGCVFLWFITCSGCGVYSLSCFGCVFLNSSMFLKVHVVLIVSYVLLILFWLCTPYCVNLHICAGCFYTGMYSRYKYSSFSSFSSWNRISHCNRLEHPLFSSSWLEIKFGLFVLFKHLVHTVVYHNCTGIYIF